MVHSDGPRNEIHILPFSISVNNGLILLFCVCFVSSARHFSQSRGDARGAAQLRQRQQPEALDFSVNGKNFTKIGERSAVIAALRKKN